MVRCVSSSGCATKSNDCAAQSSIMRLAPLFDKGFNLRCDPRSVSISSTDCFCWKVLLVFFVQDGVEQLSLLVKILLIYDF